MAINHFECPICKKYTKHVELSATEVGAMRGETGGWEIVNKIGGDYLGMKKFSDLVLSAKDWKCCECGLGSRRKPDGTIKDCFKNGVSYVLVNGNLIKYK